MFAYFKNLSTQRQGWALLSFSSLILELTALYFQYGMGLAPCVMCIYERVALFGVMFAGFIGLIAPRNMFFRLSGLLIGLGSSTKGLMLAIKHVDYQINPAPWNQCAFFTDFPKAFPLDKWFPYMFQPSGDCSSVVWSMWGLSMAQWIVVMFATITAILTLLLVSQVKKSKNQHRTLFR